MGAAIAPYWKFRDLNQYRGYRVFLDDCWQRLTKAYLTKQIIANDGYPRVDNGSAGLGADWMPLNDKCGDRSRSIHSHCHCFLSSQFSQGLRE